MAAYGSGWWANAADCVRRRGAIMDAAPDVAAIDVEGAAEQAAVVAFVSLDSLRPAEPKRHPSSVGSS